MAQVLVGYNESGSIRKFDSDGTLDDNAGIMNQCFFVNFSRLLTKDEIKKGSFSLSLAVDEAFGSEGDNHTYKLVITDASGSNGYFVNSPVGEYGILYATQSAGAAAAAAGNIMNATLRDNQGLPCGLIFYQAGVAVVSSSVFTISTTGGLLRANSGVGATGPKFYNHFGLLGTDDRHNALLTGSFISACERL